MIAIGIEQPTRKTVAYKLNILLSYEAALYIKTLKCHWNVYGKHFGALHLFFKEQYEQLFVIMDDVAERVRALDEFSFGTLEEFKQHSKLPEHPGKDPHDLEMIEWLLRDHEAVIVYIRALVDETDDLHDMGTNNMLSDLLQQHEKMAWMLRAHVQNK